MVNNKQRACDVCYQRKIRCEASGTQGVCDWCAHQNLVCTFTRRKRKQRQSSTSTSRLVKRLEDVERKLQLTRTSTRLLQAPPSPANSSKASQTSHRSQTTTDSRKCAVCRMQCASPSAANTPTGTIMNQIRYPDHSFGILCSRTGIPHFSPDCQEWIFHRTGQRPQFHFSQIRDLRGTLASFPPSCPLELPPKWVLDSLLDEFFSCDFSLVFPLLDPVLFEETASLAYEQVDDASLDHISAKACVFAFLAFASIHHSSSKAANFVDSKAFSDRARVLLSDIFEDASVTTLQTVLVLFLLETNVGRTRAGVMYHAVACRTVCALGGHITVDNKPQSLPVTVDERETRHIRRLFWLCYLFDKESALRTGHPPVLNDSFCDLTLPEDSQEARFGQRRRDPNDDSQVPFFPSDLRLSILKSKAASTLYSSTALRKSNADLLKTIRELDEELEAWRSSIPKEFCPSLSVREGVRLPLHLTESASMLHVELHMEYHYLMNVIHCASGRCVTSAEATSDWTNKGIQSSLDVSLEASRSTLVYLTGASSRIAPAAFWMFIFYPLSAMMTLFFSILRDPSSEHAAQDAELLSGSAKVVRGMRVHKMTGLETTYLEQVDAFVAELGRLTRCAIAKSSQR